MLKPDLNNGFSYANLFKTQYNPKHILNLEFQNLTKYLEKCRNKHYSSKTSLFEIHNINSKQPNSYALKAQLLNRQPLIKS